MRVNLGTKVEFRTDSGTKVTGVVARLRDRTSRGVNRDIRQSTDNDVSVKVAEVVKGSSYWVVPLTKLSIVSAPTRTSREKAVKDLSRIKRALKDRERKSKESRSTKVDRRNLSELKPGSPILVRFGDSWMRATFLQFTESKRVKFERNGVTDIAEPHRVRKIDVR